MDDLAYSFEKYQKGIVSLVDQIGGKKVDYLCGLHRGGLIPTVHLSHLLRIPMLTFDWRSPRSQETMLEYIKSQAKILMVDEVIYNGWTVGVVSKLLEQKFDWVTLVYNPKLKIKQVFYHMKIDTSRYTGVKFWWE